MLTVSMARDLRRAPGCHKHHHMLRVDVHEAVAEGKMSWLTEDVAEALETPEAFLARYTRRTKGQTKLMDLEVVVNSTPIDQTARLVSIQQ